MSGFFSLGGKDQQEDHHQQHQQQDTTSSLFLFKNEEIYNKGFDLWQQYCQLHTQRLQNHHQVQDVDFSVGPSRRIVTSAGSGPPGGGGGGIDEPSLYRSGAAGGGGFRVMRSLHGVSSSSSGMNCQDCGNQAKKDCPHLRCRTCCKSRGFHCETHVKSTWVPAAKRRERQQQLSNLSQQQQPTQNQQNQEQQQQLQQLSLRGETPVKRPREHHHASSSSSNLACTRLTTTSSGLEVGHFPAELNSAAVFRCVRVSAIDDAEDQFAYQTAVNIGGHVFKGILYDQGPESRFSGGGGGEGSSGSGGPHHQQQPLNLITGVTSNATTATTTTTGAGIFPNQAITMLDPSVYPTPLTAFMAGTQFFPPPRP